MQILFFKQALDSNLGGIESFLRNLYTQIDKSYVEFDFVTEHESPALATELQNMGAHIYKVESVTRNPCKYIKEVKNLLLSEYDVVHIHKNSAANILAVQISSRFGIPIIIHSYNTMPSVGKCAYILHAINKRKLYRLSDVHLACSTEAGKWLYGNNKFNVVKNGIITNKFLYSSVLAHNKRTELNLKDDELVIGHIGRFTEQKNQAYLVSIFMDIIKKDQIQNYCL